MEILGHRIQEEVVIPSTNASAQPEMDEDVAHMKGPAEFIRSDLFNMLPDNMVPARLFIVNQIPQSASGKVDVEALKRSEAFQLVDKHRLFLAPPNAVEAAICRIWREELELEDVSASDNFFELGGDSLQVVSIAHAINDQFGTELPIEAIFSAPTVEQLSARLGSEGEKLVAAPFCWLGRVMHPMSFAGQAWETIR